MNQEATQWIVGMLYNKKNGTMLTLGVEVSCLDGRPCSLEEPIDRNFTGHYQLRCPSGWTADAERTNGHWELSKIERLVKDRPLIDGRRRPLKKTW